MPPQIGLFLSILFFFNAVVNGIVSYPIVLVAMGAEGVALSAAVYVALGIALHAPIWVSIPAAILVGSAAFLMSMGMIAKKIKKGGCFQKPIAHPSAIPAADFVREHLGIAARAKISPNTLPDSARY